tara:strand:- start:1220 stop:1525 length:306 start_codon:yes stop_codon:yes gene_type:complete
MIHNKPLILSSSSFKSRKQEMFTLDLRWKLRDTIYKTSFLVLHYDYRYTWRKMPKYLIKELCEMMCWDSLEKEDTSWGDITYGDNATIEWYYRYGRAIEDG